MHRTRQLTDHERDERRERDRQRLKQAAEQLLSSDGWQRWVRIRAQNGLSRYSVNNQLLIALACPEASYVCGFRTWLQLGYQVRKGEKAIWILAPITVKNRARREIQNEDGEDQRQVFFRAVPVFDRSQVAPLQGITPTPLAPSCQPLMGDSHAHLLAPMQAFTESLGFTVTFEPIPGETGGWCDHNARRIVVDADQPANARLRILIHETVHALGVGYAQYGRERAEVIVDTTTYVAAASVGLDVSGESIAYIAGWGEDGALDAVTAFASTIDELARRIETVLNADPVSGNPRDVRQV